MTNDHFPNDKLMIQIPIPNHLPKAPWELTNLPK